LKNGFSHHVVLLEWDDTSAEILGDWGILVIFWRFLGDPSAGCKDLEVMNLGQLDHLSETKIHNQIAIFIIHPKKYRSFPGMTPTPSSLVRHTKGAKNSVGIP
jgi:hypothetical protein